MGIKMGQQLLSDTLIDEGFKGAIGRCRNNLPKYLPAISKDIPFDRICWKDDNGSEMVGRDMAFDYDWVLHINKQEILWFFEKREYMSNWGIHEAQYDIQSVVIHEIVEAGLREHFNYPYFLEYFHLLGQGIENKNRLERGLDVCSVCSADLVFKANKKTAAELFSEIESIFADPINRAILYLTVRPHIVFEKPIILQEMKANGT